MSERIRRRVVAVGIWCLAVTTSLGADTLVLRDGQRIRGQLVGVRGDRVDFERERSGFFGGRERIEVDRDDVGRIEFDDISRERYDSDRDDRDRDDLDGRARRPSGLRERNVGVDSRVAWNDTGVDVRAGETVYFHATGRVHWGPHRDDGPEGEHDSPRNDGRPIPSRPAAALIGRIGDSRDFFFIGDDEGPMRVRSSGRLYLGVNDDFLQDNSGNFRVTVYY